MMRTACCLSPPAARAHGIRSASRGSWSRQIELSRTMVERLRTKADEATSPVIRPPWYSRCVAGMAGRSHPGAANGERGGVPLREEHSVAQPELRESSLLRLGNWALHVAAGLPPSRRRLWGYVRGTRLSA